MATREQVLSQPRSGARPLGNGDSGPGQRMPPAAPRPARSSRPGPSQTTVARQRRSGGNGGQPPGRGAVSRRSRSQSPVRQVRRQYRAHVTTNYERVIVAEFIVVVLVVALAPFTRKQRDNVSPYYGQDLVQLVAIMAAYFVLGLVAQAGQGSARVAAWFGGLLAVGIGLGEAAYLAKVFDLFGAVQAKASQPAGESQGPQDAGAAPTQTGA